MHWLEHDLANTDKEWIFVFTHVPLVDGKRRYNITAYDACEPLFQLYGVDAVLQGHFHFYMRRYYWGIPYFILGGGGGQLFYSDQPDADVLEQHHHPALLGSARGDELLRDVEYAQQFLCRRRPEPLRRRAHRRFEGAHAGELAGQPPARTAE